MTTFTRFEDLPAWNTAKNLSNLIYDLSDQGKFARDFGLRDQIRRAAVSVMSNIAEGFDSSTNPLFRSYLSRAKASAGEVKSQLYLARDRDYIRHEDFKKARELAESCSGQLRGFLSYLRKVERSK